MTAPLVGMAILLLLGYVNVRLGSSILYPPAHFALLWSGLLMVSVLFRQMYFPLSVEAVSIFCVGAVAFSVGGAIRRAMGVCGLPTPAVRSDAGDSAYIQLFLALGLISLTAALPAFWKYMVSTADPRLGNLWWGIRSGAIAASEFQGMKSWQQLFYDNIPVAAILLALTAAACHRPRPMSRLVALAIVLVAAAINFETASKVGAASVLLGAFGTHLARRRRIKFRHALVAFMCVAIIFVPITLLRAKGEGVQTLTADDLNKATDTVLLYTVGPLVAFDTYLRNPATVPDTWTVWYAVRHLVNRLGFDVSAPSIHMGYVPVTQTANINVYTLYFAYYPDFGWAGVVLIMALLGYGSVWVYDKAVSGSFYLLIMFGLLFEGICTSGFNESFLLNLNLWWKTVLYCTVLLFVQRLSVVTPTHEIRSQHHSCIA